MALRGEEAREELPVGREPRPRAGAAERLRDGGDDADLAAAVEVAEAAGDLAAVVRLERLERPFVCPTSMYSMKRRMCPLPRK
jgi:hypothetical protein